MKPVPVPLSRPARAALAVLLCALIAIAGVVFAAPPARAADQGAGFGTWAPQSAHGWHGSMLVGGVHTYCIVPGLPLPTGGTTDHGVSGSAAGLSAQQLAGINLLVTKYGQTSDAVQAAATGWAVKAIANRDATLHAWGYRGGSLAEAVHWTFSKLAPEHAGAVAQLAEAYYAEGAGAAVPSAAATLTLTTDPTDARSGTVRLDAPATGTITLTNAVFTDTGAAERTDAAPATDYAITAAPHTADGMPFTVHAAAHGTVGFAPAVHHYTTAGQQDTAGPGGDLDFSAEAQDASARPVLFAPGLTTHVVSPEVEGGPFADDVDLKAVEGVWPKTADGAFVTLRASAKVYRTENVLPETEAVPDGAVEIGDLALVTDSQKGPGVYRVVSDWELPGPGVYTAVWQITASNQDAATAAHLEPDYLWQENFGVATQMTTVTTPPPPPAPPQPPAAQPPVEDTRTLAATGPDEYTARLGGAGAAALILGSAFLAHLMQRRRAAADR